MERFDLFHLIHKALRHAVLTFNIDSGRTDYTNDDAVAALRASWSELCTNIGHHALHEDEIVFPLLRARAPFEPRHPYGWTGEVEGLTDDHVRIERLESDMDEVLERVQDAPDATTRRVLGREFHRAVQRYTAMCLLHFDDEERHLMSRLWTLYEDDELVEAYERIMSVVDPKERQYGLRHMADALDPVELEEVRQRMAAAS
jgi:hypothetical protein